MPAADAPAAADLARSMRQRLSLAQSDAERPAQEMCKLFMLGKPHSADCQARKPAHAKHVRHAALTLCPPQQRSHLAPDARPPCAQFARAGRCARGAECWFPHSAAQPAAASDAHSDSDAPRLVLQAPRVRMARVAAAAAAALRCSVDASAAVRGDDSRGCDFALFAAMPPGSDARHAGAALAADEDLAGGVTRALWVQARAGSASEAAAAAAACALAAAASEAAPRVQLRVFPPWAYADVRCALSAAGLRCNEAGPPPALVLDVAGAAAAHSWRWGVWRADAAPALLGARCRPSYDGQVPCRALHKLDEALRRRLLRLRAGDCCADVGAAPGGWTLRLSHELVRLEGTAQTGAAPVEAASTRAPGHVWAVDPGELTLAPMPLNCTHLRLRGEDAAAPIAAALGKRRLDWVFCDANTHPPAAAALALALEDLMAADCGVMLTWKRFAAGAVAHEADVHAARAALASRGFREAACEHLFANGEHERTSVWLRGAAGAADEAQTGAR